jgi:hypothetical protein
VRADDPCEPIVDPSMIDRTPSIPKTGDSGDAGRACEDQNPEAVAVDLHSSRFF